MRWLARWLGPIRHQRCVIGWPAPSSCHWPAWREVPRDQHSRMGADRAGPLDPATVPGVLHSLQHVHLVADRALRPAGPAAGGRTLHRRPRFIDEADLTKPLTMIVPAYNEAVPIVD